MNLISMEKQFPHLGQIEKSDKLPSLKNLLKEESRVCNTQFQPQPLYQMPYGHMMNYQPQMYVNQFCNYNPPMETHFIPQPIMRMPINYANNGFNNMMQFQNQQYIQPINVMSLNTNEVNVNNMEQIPIVQPAIPQINASLIEPTTLSRPHDVCHLSNEFIFYAFQFKPRRKRKGSKKMIDFHEIVVNEDGEGEKFERFGNAPSYKHTCKIRFSLRTDKENIIKSEMNKPENKNKFNAIRDQKEREEMKFQLLERNITRKLDDLKLYIVDNGEEAVPENMVYLENEFQKKKLKESKKKRKTRKRRVGYEDDFINERDERNNSDFSDFFVEYGLQIPKSILSVSVNGEKKKFRFVVTFKNEVIYESKEFLVFAKLHERRGRGVIKRPRLNISKMDYYRSRVFENLDLRRINKKKSKFDITDLTDLKKGYFSKLKIIDPLVSVKSLEDRLAFVEVIREYINENFEQYKYIYKTKYVISVQFLTQPVFHEDEIVGEDQQIILHFASSDKGHLMNRINSFKRQNKWKLIGEIKRKKRKRDEDNQRPSKRQKKQ